MQCTMILEYTNDIQYARLMSFKWSLKLQNHALYSM